MATVGEEEGATIVTVVVGDNLLHEILYNSL